MELLELLPKDDTYKEGGMDLLECGPKWIRVASAKSWAIYQGLRQAAAVPHDA